MKEKLKTAGWYFWVWPVILVRAFQDMVGVEFKDMDKIALFIWALVLLSPLFIMMFPILFSALCWFETLVFGYCLFQSP